MHNANMRHTYFLPVKRSYGTACYNPKAAFSFT